MSKETLRKISICYLLIPNVLFGLGWFRAPYSIIITVGYCYLFYTELKKKGGSTVFTKRDLVIILIWASIWVFFSGVGGYTEQSFDWLGHNSKFYDLYKNEWPIYFHEVGRFATYYFGYYLLPALISKAVGYLLPVLLVGWTLIGFFLALLWIYLLLNKNQILLFFFFFLRGTGQLVNELLIRFTFLDIGRGPSFMPSIRSLFRQSTFAPNQLIPVFICCGMMVHALLHRKKNDDLFFVVTLMFIWGVFPAISTMVIFILLTLRRYFFEDGLKDLTLGYLSKNYILPGLLFIPTFIYFLSSDGTIIRGLLFSFEPRKDVIISYFVSVMLDLLLLFIIANSLNNQRDSFPRWVTNFLLAGLALLSLYRLGKYNDLFMRGAPPFSAILFIAILRGADIAYKNRKMPKSVIFYPAALLMTGLVLMQAIGIIPNLLRNNIVTSYFLGSNKDFIEVPYDAYPNTYQVLLNGYKDEEGAKQYLAAKNSWYERYLSRKIKSD